MCKYLVLVLCCALSFTYARECRKVGDCSCEYYDGTGVDLRPIVGHGGPPLQANHANGTVYYFSPCEDLIYTPDNTSNNDTENNHCAKGYTLCQALRQEKGIVNYTRLGELKETQFTSDKEGDGLYLTYNKTNQSTHVKLVCTTDKTTFFFPETSEKGITKLLLFSPHACPITIEDFSKPSTGTVLLIMLFIAFLSYFVIGATVNALYIGARGMEIIPHVDFWRDLPNLVRDGAQYLQNGCRVTSQTPNPDSYDAI